MGRWSALVYLSVCIYNLFITTTVLTNGSLFFALSSCRQSVYRYAWHGLKSSCCCCANDRAICVKKNRVRVTGIEYNIRDFKQSVAWLSFTSTSSCSLSLSRSLFPHSLRHSQSVRQQCIQRVNKRKCMHTYTVPVYVCIFNNNKIEHWSNCQFANYPFNHLINHRLHSHAQISRNFWFISDFIFLDLSIGYICVFVCVQMIV